MLTEQGKLRKISDKIWYEWPFLNKYGWMLDIREIIFTTEFIDKIEEYIYNDQDFSNTWDWLKNNLDNPTEYLYILMFSGF